MTPLDEGSALPDNTQHSQQTDVYASGRVRTYNLSRRAAVDLRLRPRGHRDRLKFTLEYNNNNNNNNNNMKIWALINCILVCAAKRIIKVKVKPGQAVRVPEG